MQQTAVPTLVSINMLEQTAIAEPNACFYASSYFRLDRMYSRSMLEHCVEPLLKIESHLEGSLVRRSSAGGGTCSRGQKLLRRLQSTSVTDVCHFRGNRPYSGIGPFKGHLHEMIFLFRFFTLIKHP
jgi:hypothetical protein